MKKAFLVIPHWADDTSASWGKRNSSPTYAETAGKAKYQKFLDMDIFDNDDWFKYRSLRWPEMDLFPPVLDTILKEISAAALDKLRHTYGVDSREPGHRNYYNGAVDDPDFKILIQKNLAVRDASRDHMLHKGSTYFHLTEKGIKAAMSTREKIREALR